MIKDDGKYFLYRHIRIDKNEVFYIGIGTKYYGKLTHNEIYRRAYLKASRNILWTRIINKTSYIIEIICESDSYDFIQEKEKEFISLYGRKDLNTGTLCNFTDGGEGQLGIRKQMTDETKNKISIANKNKPKSQSHKKSLSDAKLKNPNKYWNGKKFSEEHKEKLKYAKKKQYENNQYNSCHGKYRIKLTKVERKKIYKDTANKNTGGGNKDAKMYKIEYDGIINIEKTTIRQIHLKYKISQYITKKILKSGKEKNGLKISLYENII